MTPTPQAVDREAEARRRPDWLTVDMLDALKGLPRNATAFKRMGSVRDEIHFEPLSSYVAAVCGPDAGERQKIARALWVMLRIADHVDLAALAATSPKAMAGDVGRYYKRPFSFHEPEGNEAAFVRDADGYSVAMLMWAGHGPDDEDDATAETYAIGRAFAGLFAPIVPAPAGEGRWLDEVFRRNGPCPTCGTAGMVGKIEDEAASPAGEGRGGGMAD